MSSAVASILRPCQLPELSLACPASRDEVLDRLAGGAHPLAGGTDIVVWASQRGEPRELVWTGGVAELQRFDSEVDPIRVGAGVTLARIVRSAAFRAAAPAVADGAQSIGSVQLRNQATLVGNVCTASPAGDTIPGLLVHDAVIELVSASGGQRRLDLDEFLVAPGQTAAKRDELVTFISVCALGPREASAYQRFTQREALDLAFASVAARLAFEPDGRTVSTARLALGAVGPTALEVREAAATLVGRPLSDTGLRACAEIAAQSCAPISDLRAGADYRRQLVKALVVDVVEEADRRAQVSERGEHRT